ncbi:MAG TPA: hypothetical protein VGR02_18920 [Thermoanaerobaculia bacterium]|jgi:hypothetical protein|nr:hypothetical protein [Thermoanaerobaculia bacterium]
MIPLLLFAAVTATFSPSKPTIGDPVTIQFQGAVRLDQSPQYEIVSQQGTRAVVRTFRARPIELHGTVSGVPFRGLTIPIQSVLRPDDKLDPAPLEPPHPTPWPRLPFLLIGAAAFAAALIWTLVAVLARRRANAVAATPALTPIEQFRRSVLALHATTPMRWAQLADATRAYLALGDELTTTQLLQRLDAGRDIVAEILRQGDYEKFSPWGAPAADFEAVRAKALQLPALYEPQPEEQAAA